MIDKRTLKCGDIVTYVFYKNGLVLCHPQKGTVHIDPCGNKVVIKLSENAKNIHIYEIKNPFIEVMAVEKNSQTIENEINL